jgi:hypothetical protein
MAGAVVGDRRDPALSRGGRFVAHRVPDAIELTMLARTDDSSQVAFPDSRTQNFWYRRVARMALEQFLKRRL